LTVTQTDGSSVAFLATGGYHHIVALNTWTSARGTPPPRGHTGLFHVALLYPDSRALARAVRRVQAAGRVVGTAQDHGVSEAVYITDPDGNGVELYRDRPETDWPRTDTGHLAMPSDSLDLSALLAEAPPTGPVR